MDSNLGKRMVAAADKDGYPADHNLRLLAQKFEAAIAGFYTDPPTVTVQQFMGHYARARRAWCEYSGDDLV